MSRHNLWAAILTGIFLLVAGPYVDVAERWVTNSWQPVIQVVEVDPADDTHQIIVSVLTKWNPRLSKRVSSRIADSVLRCKREQDLSPELVLRVMLTESGARPSAYSNKGAVGLMQVMPYMFRRLEIPGSVAHLEANVEAGCLLLEDNIRRLGEDRGILAYFWGSRIRGDKYLQRVRSTLPGLDLSGATTASAQ